MCYSNCNCVVLVVVLDSFVYLDEQVKHRSHLFFVGGARARDGALHLPRSVLEDSQPLVRRRLDKGAAHFGQVDPTDRLKQSMVDARYRMEISTNQ